MIRFVSLLVLSMVLAQSLPASAQDAALGEKTFLKCKACHQIGEGARNGVGPNLNGLIGRKSGSVEGFKYSKANSEAAIVWTAEKLDPYIKAPREIVPGTTMAYAGLRNDDERANLIAYLTTLK